MKYIIIIVLFSILCIGIYYFGYYWEDIKNWFKKWIS
jgi:hypothetical protein